MNKKEKERLDLLDYRGFDAALRSRILDFARKRSMLGSSSFSNIMNEDEDDVKE